MHSSHQKMNSNTEYIHSYFRQDQKQNKTKEINDGKADVKYKGIHYSSHWASSRKSHMELFSSAKILACFIHILFY